jgi:hypothetical protein
MSLHMLGAIGFSLFGPSDAVKGGDAAFAQMKLAADTAKWPADLTDQVKFLDKSWVAARDAGDDATVNDLTAKMKAVTGQLTARFGNAGGAKSLAPSTPSAPPKSNAPPADPKAPSTFDFGEFFERDLGGGVRVKYVAAGVGGLSALGLVWYFVKRRVGIG